MNIALQSDTREIVVEANLPHAPEAIWRALTTGELMHRWLQMTPTGFVPVKGTRFTYQTKAAGAWDGSARGCTSWDSGTRASPSTTTCSPHFATAA